MTTYSVQSRNFSGRWAKLGYGHREHATEQAAWEQACSYDEDGLLTSTYRVVDSTGKAMPRPKSMQVVPAW